MFPGFESPRTTMDMYPARDFGFFFSDGFKDKML
jgi:hypothetical protein